MKKGKSIDEQYRLESAACALVRCADGVPPDDPNYSRIQTMQKQGQLYQTEQIALLNTGQFIYQPYLDSARDFITKHSEAQQRIGGGVDLLTGFVGTVGTVGSGLIVVSGTVGCSPTIGASCALVPLGVYLAIISSKQAQEGNKSMIGSYRSTEGQRVLASFDPLTHPNDSDPLKKISIDAAKFGLTMTAGKIASKVFVRVNGFEITDQTIDKASFAIRYSENKNRLQLLEKVIDSGGELNVSQTVARQLAGPRSYIATQSVLDTIASGARITDPQGVPYQFMYIAPAKFNGSSGASEVLVHEQSGQIRHVLFRRGK